MENTEKRIKPASSYLEPEVIEYLQRKLKESKDGRYEFERSEITKHLIEKFKDKKDNTDGARTGVLNRLFESDNRIKKISHGKYVYQEERVINGLGKQDLVDELKRSLKNVEALTEGTFSKQEFMKEDREFFYLVHLVAKELDDLIEKVDNE